MGECWGGLRDVFERCWGIFCYVLSCFCSFHMFLLFSTLFAMFLLKFEGLKVKNMFYYVLLCSAIFSYRFLLGG